MKIIIFLFTAFTFSGNLFSQWLADVRITNDSARSFTCFNNSKGVSASGNYVHVVWFDERISTTNREIFYKRSTNYGQSFGADIRLTDSTGASEDPCISTVGSTVQVIWKESRNGNYEIYYKRSSDNGSTWGNDMRLTNNPSYSLYPSVSASGNIVHAVWEEYRDNNATGEIYYKHSTDNGITWGADVRLTNNTSQSLFPSVCSRDMNVYTAWADSRDGGTEIYFKLSTDGGDSWGADTRLTNSPGTSDDACISVTGTTLHVTWKDMRDGNLEAYYKRSTDGGTTWGNDTRLSTTSGQTWYATIGASGQNVHVVYDDYTSGSRLYHSYSTNGGSSWNSALLSTHTLGEFRPSITVLDSSVHMVWTDTRDQGAVHEEVYYKRNPTGVNAVNNISSEIPTGFMLLQNYPNPFNPVTNIEFSVPKSSFVKMTVYDALGREIDILVNEHLKAGTYKADWNASKYPSGIYFYKLVTEGFSETKKMALIK